MLQREGPPAVPPSGARGPLMQSAVVWLQQVPAAHPKRQLWIPKKQNLRLRHEQQVQGQSHPA